LVPNASAIVLCDGCGILRTKGSITVARTAVPKAKPVPARGAAKTARSTAAARGTGAAIAMEEARRAGLLDGERTEHVSFRAPKALIELDTNSQVWN